MNYTQIKKIKKFCGELHSLPNWRDVVEGIQENVADFEIDNVRFINSESIQDILEDEICADTYTLGLFSAYAIAEATGWPLFLVELAQKNEEYEELGNSITGEHLCNLASIYASQDGYGHHFNSYDGSEEEIKIDGLGSYYVFDNQ